jgi:hypothetical protein
MGAYFSEALIRTSLMCSKLVRLSASTTSILLFSKALYVHLEENPIKDYTL